MPGHPRACMKATQSGEGWKDAPEGCETPTTCCNSPGDLTADKIKHTKRYVCMIHREVKDFLMWFWKLTNIIWWYLKGQIFLLSVYFHYTYIHPTFVCGWGCVCRGLHKHISIHTGTYQHEGTDVPTFNKVTQASQIITSTLRSNPFITINTR